MNDKFKVGDIVRVVSVRHNVYFELGDVLEITSINNDYELFYCCKRRGDGRLQNVAEWQLELVERESAVEYKVGDRVRIVQKGHSDENLRWADEMDKYVGQVGIVTEIGLNGNLRIDVNGGKWFYRPAWVEPVTESPSSTAPLFSSALSSFFGFSKRKDVPAPSLPLIEPHKLLTDIKLD